MKFIPMLLLCLCLNGCLCALSIWSLNHPQYVTKKPNPNGIDEITTIRTYDGNGGVIISRLVWWNFGYDTSIDGWRACTYTKMDNYNWKFLDYQQYMILSKERNDASSTRSSKSSGGKDQ